MSEPKTIEFALAYQLGAGDEWQTTGSWATADAAEQVMMDWINRRTVAAARLLEVRTTVRLEIRPEPSTD